MDAGCALGRGSLLGGSGAWGRSGGTRESLASASIWVIYLTGPNAGRSNLHEMTIGEHEHHQK